MPEPMSYHSGTSVRITEHTFAHLAFVTGEAAVPLGEAALARIEINFLRAKRITPDPSCASTAYRPRI